MQLIPYVGLNQNRIRTIINGVVRAMEARGMDVCGKYGVKHYRCVCVCVCVCVFVCVGVCVIQCRNCGKILRNPSLAQRVCGGGDISR